MLFKALLVGLAPSAIPVMECGLDMPCGNKVKVQERVLGLCIMLNEIGQKLRYRALGTVERRWLANGDSSGRSSSVWELRRTAGTAVSGRAEHEHASTSDGG